MTSARIIAVIWLAPLGAGCSGSAGLTGGEHQASSPAPAASPAAGLAPSDEQATPPQEVSGAFLDALACAWTPNEPQAPVSGNDLAIGCNVDSSSQTVAMAGCSPVLALYADAAMTQPVATSLPLKMANDGSTYAFFAALPPAYQTTGMLSLTPQCPGKSLSVRPLATAAISSTLGRQAGATSSANAAVAGSSGDIPSTVTAMALWDGGLTGANSLGQGVETLSGAHDAFTNGINPSDFCSQGQAKAQLQPSSGWNSFLVNTFNNSVISSILSNGQPPISTAIVTQPTSLDTTDFNGCFTELQYMGTSTTAMALEGAGCVFVRSGTKMYIIKSDPTQGLTSGGVGQFVASRKCS